MVAGFRMRASIGCVIVFVLFVMVPATLVGQRVCCEGDMWLKWNDTHRKAFVDGYAEGYLDGFREGCQKDTADLRQEIKPGTDAKPQISCVNEGPDFSKGGLYLVKAVTDFYKRYPSDRDIYITEVLEQLGKGLTIEQIHNHPFMRHKSAGGNRPDASKH